jgi:hypothetical protein
MRRMGFKSKKRSVVGETMVHGLSGLSDAASAYRELASSRSEYSSDLIFANRSSNEWDKETQTGLLVLLFVVAASPFLPSRHVCPEPPSSSVAVAAAAGT